MPPKIKSPRLAFCALLFIFCVPKIFSQNFIQGSVVDSTKSPLAFCTVALLKAQDSSVVKGNLTDEKGEFTFQKIGSGSYRVKYVNVGYKAVFSELLQVDSLSKI